MKPQNTACLEVWHGRYNLQGRDNLHALPEEKAVFGVFAVVDGKPLNCRYVAAADNLRKGVAELFEHPPGEGMKKFIQGPWVPMLVYELLPGTSLDERQQTARAWCSEYHPDVAGDGEYPGYYEW